MGIPNPIYGLSRAGMYLKPDIGTWPGNPGLEALEPWWADIIPFLPLPRQENLGSFVDTYRTGRYVQVYQDVSNLTAQQPVEQVYPPGITYLQPITLVYQNIATSPSLGGKAGF